MAGVLRKTIQAQAEQFRAACFEFVKTRVHPPVQSKEELVAFLTPLAEDTKQKEISPNDATEMCNA